MDPTTHFSIQRFKVSCDHCEQKSLSKKFLILLHYSDAFMSVFGRENFVLCIMYLEDSTAHLLKFCYYCLLDTALDLKPKTQTQMNNLNSNLSPSPSIANLIEHLRRYKPPQEEEEEEEEEEEDGAVGEDVGLAESTAGPVRFRPKRAAVLICLFEDGAGQLRVILTKRSSNLSTHSGEVSLPGGKAEEGDADDRATALREAREEIGLDPSLVTVAAVLEPFLSKHLLRVVPVIGLLSDRKSFTPIANTAEVETVFDAPLEMFLKDENRRSEELEWMGNKFMVHFFDFGMDNKQFLIWGLTASILIHAASVIYQRPPSFPEQKPKFKIPRVLPQNYHMP